MTVDTIDQSRKDTSLVLSNGNNILMELQSPSSPNSLTSSNGSSDSESSSTTSNNSIHERSISATEQTQNRPRKNPRLSITEKRISFCENVDSVETFSSCDCNYHPFLTYLHHSLIHSFQ
jgi:hypothetical protein